MSESPQFGRTIEPSENVHRDAVHVAVIPWYAGETLLPGDHVGLSDVGAVKGAAQKVGIVDPFLKSAAKRGDRFWLFLYPNTIVGMRHHWRHPAFDGAEV